MGLLVRHGRLLSLVACLLTFAPLISLAQAGDWPMWRADAHRGGATNAALPEKLHLQWAITLPTPKPAWPPDQGKLQFDASYEPVVVGQRMFVPSMVSDNVSAYDTRSGKLLWRFFAEGPVRFAPVATAERIYFVSDDGYLYCVASKDGSLVWKFRGGPNDRKVLGNDRLVSMWPARGAPVLVDDTIYFAASIWPFMGTFIHAIDAQTGEARWTNSGSGSNYLQQPHNSPAFANVAPQGYLAVCDKILAVPGGRSIPAGYDLTTGKFLHFQAAASGKKGGGYDVVAGPGWLQNRGGTYKADDGKITTSIEGTDLPILFGDRLLQVVKGELQLLSSKPSTETTDSFDKKGLPIKVTKQFFGVKAKGRLPKPMKRAFIKAGNRVYGASRENDVIAVDIPQPVADGELTPTLQAVWQAQIRGEVWSMLAADDRLFVVSREGEIFCFGAEGPKLSLDDLPKPTSNQVALVPLGSKWRVINDGKDQGTKWREPDFDDKSWANQTAEIFYGDPPVSPSSKKPDETSPLKSPDKTKPAKDQLDREQPDKKPSSERPTAEAAQEIAYDDSAPAKDATPKGDAAKEPVPKESAKKEPAKTDKETEAAKALAGKKVVTTYLRHEFDVPAESRFIALTARVKMEDGAVLYLNGEEVSRLFMSTDEIKYTTAASAGGTQSVYHFARLEPEQLRPGRNVLAVEIHKSGQAGADPTFDLQLLATPFGDTGRAGDADDPAASTAKKMLALSETPLGYVVVHGGHNPKLIHELAALANQHVIVLEDDTRVAAALRKQFTEQGFYGSRIAVIEGDSSASLPPYMAAMVVCTNMEAAGLAQNPAWARRVIQPVRPYGGIVVLTATAEEHETIAASLKGAEIPGIEIERHEGWTILRRRGPLPGSAVWTHQNADVGNSLMSRDNLVKAPLGLLWFGGPSNEEVLPRHGHGPSPQVMGGRLVIEGTNMLRAVDVYTGRKLWQRSLPGLGDYYNNTAHHPGANAIGSNYCLTPEGVYVAYGREGLKLDPATGETILKFVLPADESGEKPFWGYIGVHEDLLIAGSSPVLLLSKRGGSKSKSDDDDDSKLKKLEEMLPMKGKRSSNDSSLPTNEKFVSYNAEEKPAEKPSDKNTDKPADKASDKPAEKPVEKKPTIPLEVGKHLGSDAYVRHAEGCRRLVVMDRHTGKVLWSRDAFFEFRHNSIIAAGDLIFCIDGMTAQRLALLARRGIGSKQPAVLYALNAKTGEVVWSTNENVGGTWLSYSAKHNLVLQAGSKARDRAADESGQGMVAYDATTGKVRWKHDDIYTGPCLMADDMIITQGDAFSYETGKRYKRKNPLTGEEIDWGFTRNYGCNTVIGCTNLLTFRSAAAGYFNLAEDGGTGNFGGFRASCTSNLIPADGILNAPDYTRTCTCSYQNQCSLAMVYMPENEEWTFNQLKWKGQRIERVGINLGAPGDRKSATGTLWLDYPSVGGFSPEVPIKLDGMPKTVRVHSSLMESPRDDAEKIPAWVVASSLENVSHLEISLVKAEKGKEDEVEPAHYTLRLFFAELADVKPGERVFDINIQHEKMEDALDVVAAAGGPRRGIMKEYRGIEIGATLSLSLKSAKDKTKAPILAGIELILEKPEK